MIILQKIYILILNCIHPLTQKISKRIRDFGIFICCCLLFLQYAFEFSPDVRNIWKPSYTMVHLICSIIILMIIILSIDRKQEIVKWNKVVFWLMLLSGLGILAVSFLHPIGSGYRAFSLILMFGFPCMYFVWNNRGDYDTFFNIMSSATIILGILYYIVCFILSCKGQMYVNAGRVNGLCRDANQNSMIGMMMFTSAAYMLLAKRKSKLWFLLIAVSMGIGLNIIILGASRLAIIVAIGTVITFSIFVFKAKLYANRKAYFLVKATAVIVSIVVFTSIGNYMVETNTIRAIEKARLQAEETASEQTDSQENNNLEQDVATQPAPTERAINRFSPAGIDLDLYTAGRLSIWKGYAPFLNMTGNNFNKADWESLTHKTVKHAHNNFIEIAFRCGIPVACINTLLQIVTGIICLVYLFSKRYKEPIFYYAIVFAMTYLVQSLFDIATLPFERPAPLYYYISLMPVIMYSRRSTGNKNI